MFESNLNVLVDRDFRVTFVQGEDKSFDILLVDRVQQMPVDLTGSALMFAFPAMGGGSIKRRSLPLTVSCATAVTLNGFSVFTQSAHGLADGETITLAAPPQGSALPAPFVAGTPYTVNVEDANTFSFSDAGVPMVLTSTSTATLGVMTPGIAIQTPILGKLTLALGAVVTAAIASGQGQTYQLTLTDGAGLSQIVIVADQLDVFAQPFP